MDRIDLKLSEPAKHLLAEHIALTNLDVPITSVVWWEEGYITSPDGVGIWTPPRWGVGWYDLRNIDAEKIQSIDGIKFIFDQGAMSEKLNGKLLDIVNGKYVVR